METLHQRKKRAFYQIIKRTKLSIEEANFLIVNTFLTYLLDTQSKCPGGRPILHRGLKLNLKISAEKLKQN